MILLCSHRRTAAPSSPSQFWWIQLVRLKWPSDYLNFPLKVILFWTLHVHCSKSWNQRRVWSRKQTFYIFFPTSNSLTSVRLMCAFQSLQVYKPVLLLLLQCVTYWGSWVILQTLEVLSLLLYTLGWMWGHRDQRSHRDLQGLSVQSFFPF